MEEEGLNIVLCGFMASGKTTIGKALEELTGMRLVDTDGMVEERAGMSVREVFERHGEGRFREMERKAVSEAAEGEGRIIALGGGAVLDRRNVEALREKGRVYWLKVSGEDVALRAGRGAVRARSGGGGGINGPTGGAGEERPLLDGMDAEGIEELMRSREAAYREAADREVPTSGRRPREVAEEIAADYRGRSGSPEKGS